MATLLKRVFYVLAAVAALILTALLLTGTDSKTVAWMQDGNRHFKAVPFEDSEKKVLESKVMMPQDQSEKMVKVPVVTSLKQHGPDNLSSSIIAGIKKFVIFAGYPRSGHSIIGSLMDAHPHVIIAHEYFLFSQFPELNKASDSWKGNLLNTLYRKSKRNGIRALSRKGYTLEVEGLWQGGFDEYIEVIGDKSGGTTTIEYLKNKHKFLENYTKLKQELSMPIHVIHAIRNPFDMLSTALCYNSMSERQYGDLKHSASFTLTAAPPKIKASDRVFHKVFRNYFNEFNGVTKLKKVFGRENVLDVHNCDLVDNPKETISRIFKFLDVDVSNEFLNMCARKVFKSTSRSRDLVEWSQEHRKRVESEIRKYPFFARYSFTSI